MKKALISGITGQDGSYLAEFLLQKGYEVHGILRRSSSFNTGRIEHLYFDEWVRDMKQKRTINLHYGDMTDSSSLIRIIQQVQPDEIYNLAAQSHVKVSFPNRNIMRSFFISSSISLYLLKALLPSLCPDSAETRFGSFTFL